VRMHDSFLEMPSSGTLRSKDWKAKHFRSLWELNW